MKAPPFDFVLEALAPLHPYTKPMFGCLAVYVGEKIVLILRQRDSTDDGVWVATTPEHHESLRAELPSMRSIEIFGPGPTGWQVLPVSDEGFETEVAWACRLVLRGDPRIGKVPKSRRPRAKAAQRQAKKPAAKKNGRKATKKAVKKAKKKARR